MPRTKLTPEQKELIEQKRTIIINLLFKDGYNNPEIERTFFKTNWLNDLEKFFENKEPKKEDKTSKDFKYKYEKLSFLAGRIGELNEKLKQDKVS